jgi:hypothetical protein
MISPRQMAYGSFKGLCHYKPAVNHWQQQTIAPDIHDVPGGDCQNRHEFLDKFIWVCDMLRSLFYWCAFL